MKALQKTLVLAAVLAGVVAGVSPAGARYLGGIDEFEPNSKRELAMQVFAGQPQLHTINPRNDEDWLLFAPSRPGEYLLNISGVTADLKGEVWIRRGDDKEQRIGKFEVSRAGRTIPLTADHSLRYFKIRLEADDNDDTADYRVEVVDRPVVIIEPAVIGTTVIRPTVIRPTLRTPPIYRRPQTTIYNRPILHGKRSPGRSVGVIPRILGSVLVNIGRVQVGVGAGRSTRTAPTPSRSRVTVPRVNSRSQTPTRGTVRTPNRTPSRGASVTPRTSGSLPGSTVRSRVGVGGRRR